MDLQKIGATRKRLHQTRSLSKTAHPEPVEGSKSAVISGCKKHIIFVMLLSLITLTTHANTEKPTAEQALATIGHLLKKSSGQTSKKLLPDILHENLRLFIKKVVLLAKSKDSHNCPNLFLLDKKLETDFEMLEVKVLLDALSDAAYIIKNRAIKICSIEELSHLDSELNRWCEFATMLVSREAQDLSDSQ